MREEIMELSETLLDKCTNSELYELRELLEREIRLIFFFYPSHVTLVLRMEMKKKNESIRTNKQKTKTRTIRT